VDLPETLISLLYQPSTCYIATTMPDGSPQLTQTWVRGRVIDITAEGGAEHIEKLAQKYLGVPTHGPVVGGASRCASFSP